MTTPLQSTPRPLPHWLMLSATAAIVFHFTALVALVLSAPSGPWPTNFGANPAPGPPFAVAINQITTHYLRALHMTNDYHFVANVPGMPTVFFEVRVKDKSGKVLQTVTLPDERANIFVRNRQRLLAQGLGTDLPVQAPQGERVLPPGQSFPTVEVWLNNEGDPVMRLMKKSELELPRNRPLTRPSEWSMLLAQSYARYLCRQHPEADSAEVVRRTRNAIMPDALFGGPGPGGAGEQVCTFGDYRP